MGSQREHEGEAGIVVGQAIVAVVAAGHRGQARPGAEGMLVQKLDLQAGVDEGGDDLAEAVNELEGVVSFEVCGGIGVITLAVPARRLRLLEVGFVEAEGRPRSRPRRSKTPGDGPR